MTITFLPQNRRQKYLLLLLGVAVFGGLGIAWYQFVREGPLLSFQQQPLPPKQVEIDFGVFQTTAFLELGESRPPIPILLPDETGKPNPFMPPE